MLKGPDGGPTDHIHRLINEVLTELTITTFNELVKYSGVEEALREIKPIEQQNAIFIINELKKRGAINGNGPDVLLLCWMFGSFCAVEKVHGEIKERGAVGYSYDCIFKQGSPELCIAISHFSTDHLSQLINPEYECIFTHHVTDGDPYCRYVFKKKGEKNINLNELGNTLAIIPDFQISQNEKTMMRRWMLSSNWKMVTEAFVKIHGSEKAIKILSVNANRIGQKVGNQLIDLQKNDERSIETAGKIIDLLGIALNQRGSYSSKPPNEFSKEISDCPLQSTNYEICKQMEALFQGICLAFDPALEFRYEKMITNNNSSCHWILNRNTNSNGKKLKDGEKNIDETALEMLKKRLVKGEITPDQYHQLKKILNE